MHTDARQPALERLVFQSRDEEETRAFLRARSIGFHLPQNFAANLDTQIHGFALPGLYLGHARYGAPAEIWGEHPFGYEWIQIPLRGRFETISGNSRTVFDVGRGSVLSMARSSGYRLRSEAGTARLQVHLDSATLLDQLAVLLGEQPRDAIAFAPELDLTRGYGRSLAAYLATAINDLSFYQSMLDDPATMRAFIEFVMTGLLLSQPSNYFDALRRRDRFVAPRDVRRAVEFMRENLHRGVTVAEIVAASGVPGRTLFMHFRESGNGSPMGFLRDLRFKKVRELLTRASAGETVLEIALSCGFNHMGRFAVEYRKRFGEQPSETMRRARIISSAK